MISDNIQQLSSDIIIMGDININAQDIELKSWKKLYNIFSSLNLTQQIKESTRVTDKSETLIDHVWINNENMYSKCGVIRSGTSDHDIIYAIRKKKSLTKHGCTSFRYRCLDNYNIAILSNKLNEISWVEFYQCNDPNDAWELMLNIYYSVLDSVAPIKQMNNTRCKQNWITKESLNLIHKRDKLKLIHYKTTDKDQKKIIWNEYKITRNLCNRQITKDKKSHIQSSLKEYKDNNKCKEYWGVLLNLTGKNKNKNNSVRIKNDNNELLSDFEQANMLNKHFSTIGSKLTSEAGKRIIKNTNTSV